MWDQNKGSHDIVICEGFSNIKADNLCLNVVVVLSLNSKDNTVVTKR